MKVTRSYFKNREEFLAIRDRLHKENRLGGSDIGTAAGQNKWKSARRFYEEMVGNIQVPFNGNKQSIKDGILCEDLVARKFEELSGKKVHRENCVMTSERAEHLFASIDRKVENEESGLECKTANALNWDAFKDGHLPNGYVKQVKTYLAVTGLERWYVMVWVMGVAEYCYLFTTKPEEVEAKPAWVNAAYLVTEMEMEEVDEIAAKFLCCVINRVPPTADGSEDETEVLAELHPQDNGEEIELVKVAESDLEQIDLLEEHIKVAETNIAEIKNRIKDEMGDHAVAVCGSRKITWKNNKPSAKTDYKRLVAEMQIAPETLARYTETKPGLRVLRIGK